ncbi:MAG: hypothetical protein MJZ23_00790 [Paludibacteraceae bacterium]|nr:hypothetical protein [Paludibacteraceae bacterium]
MKKICLKVSFACGMFALTCSSVLAQSANEKYYRRSTMQEKAQERTQNPAEFRWLPAGEKLIKEMAIDYQNALFVANINQMEAGEEKNNLLAIKDKYPTEFGIRSTKVAVITAIDQLESSLELIKDTIVPSGLKKEGFVYDPEHKVDSLMTDLRKDPSSLADYRGKYYEVWRFVSDSSEAKVAIVFTPLGYETIKLLYREEANIKTDYSEIKNNFTNAEEQRDEIKEARKKYPLDYGQRLGEEYQWNLCNTWRDVVVKPTLTDEEKAEAKKATPKQTNAKPANTKKAKATNKK